MMNFDELPEFQKEFKRLEKKFKSLPKDLKEFCSVVSVVPLGNGKHFNLITKTETLSVIKSRLFCRYLKGSSLRIIYSYSELNNRIEFIEIYFKGEKENEDGKKIEEYLKRKEVI